MTARHPASVVLLCATLLVAGVQAQGGFTSVLNGVEVITSAQLPGLAARGPIALQHHGSKRDGVWTSPPSLVQFRNISIKEM